MLSCLFMSCVGSVLFWSCTIFENSFKIVNATVSVTEKVELSDFDCMYLTSIYLPSFFLSFAVLLNINKWIQFTLRIKLLAG